MPTPPNLTRAGISSRLKTILSEIQVQMGEPSQEIKDATRPIGDLPSFDSLCAVSATTEISNQLAVPVDSTLFWSKVNGKPLTFAEIVDRLETLVGRKEGKA